jgi:hypothetical protein
MNIRRIVQPRSKFRKQEPLSDAPQVKKDDPEAVLLQNLSAGAYRTWTFSACQPLGPLVTLNCTA